MTLRRILQASVPVVITVALLGACGSTGTKVATRSPAKIRVGSQSGANGEKIAGSQAPTAGDAAMRMRPTNYVLGAGLVEPTGPRTAWYFAANGPAATDTQKAALLKAFGLTGTWKTYPKDQGGAEYLGDPSKGEASLTLNPDAMRSWWYSPSWSNATVSVGCATPPSAPDDAANTSSAGSADTTDPSGATGSGTATTPSPESGVKPPTTDVTTMPCEAPAPPKNVPDKATAEAKAKALLAAIGLDANNFQLETYADQWGASVTAWLVLDGTRTQVATYVSFGAEGALTGAGGFLAQPVKGDQYDLVGLAKALVRMNDTNGRWWGGGYPMAMDGKGVGIAGDAVAPTGRANSAATSSVGGSATVDPIQPTPAPDTSTVGTEPVPVDSGPVDVPVETLPVVTDPPVEMLTVTLTGVSVGLSELWDADGNVWLIPAYLFTDHDGGQYSVFAIADEFLDFTAVDTPTPDTAVPAVTDPVGTVDSSTPTTRIDPIDTAVKGS